MIGLFKHKLYSVWQGMLNRCRNPNSKPYKNYGGRGINVCDRWKMPQKGFINFLEDMGERPLNHSLDRIDNDGDYTPENCRWATKSQQQRNRRVVRTIEIEGEQFIATTLAKKAGIKTDTLIHRADQGLSLKECMSPKRRVFAEGLKLGGAANGKKRRQMTHCKRGHEFTPENTSITKQGWRRCRKCHADNEAINRIGR